MNNKNENETIKELVNKFRESFRTVYPEKEVRIIIVNAMNENEAIIHAVFPDGSFFFIVTENTVSHSYDSFEKAKADVIRNQR